MKEQARKDNIERLKILSIITKKLDDKNQGCLFDGCSNVAINSHLLQKNGIINHIAEEGHIIQLEANLSSFIVVEQSDIDFLLLLFGKYSVTEHDGGTSTIPQLPTKSVIEQDVRDYMDWKNSFKAKHRAFVQTYN